MPSQTVTATSEQTSRRDPWFDNAKFALVALVVVGHSMTLLPHNTVDDWLYDFLYQWHVPAFVVITGYLSRSFDYSGARLWSLVRTVVVPYLVFEALMAWFRTSVGGEQIDNLWRDPHWPMWYLSALFIWRLATPIFKRQPVWLAMPIALAISIVAGNWAGTTLDLARAVGLLPFFVLGLTLRREHFAMLHRTWVRFASVGVLAVLLVTAWFTDTWISTEWLYYRTRYTELAVDPGLGMLTRLGVLGLGLAGALAALSLIPSSRTWFTRLGAASLVVYLFHGFVVKTALYLGADQWTADHPGTALVVLPVLAVLLAILIAQPAVAARLNKLVDPIGTVQDLIRPRRGRPIAPSPQVPRESVPMSSVGR